MQKKYIPDRRVAVVMATVQPCFVSSSWLFWNMELIHPFLSLCLAAAAQTNTIL